MRILLIATNQADQYMNRMVVRPLPIGLAYIAAYIDQEKHQLEFLDLMFSEDAIRDVTQTLNSFDPHIVGLSIRNLDNQSRMNTIWHLPEIKEIVVQVRSAGNAKIVCGGPAFSILPRECLDYLGADFGLAGHAFHTFGELVDRLNRQAACEDIPGLVYRTGGEIVVNEQGESEAFDKPPRLDLVNVDKYRQAGFGIGVVTKLAEDYYPRNSGLGGSVEKTWRVEPIENVVAEITRLGSQFGIRKIFFIDSSFNVPIEYAKKLCTEIIDKDIDIRWNSYVRATQYDPELFDLMKRSGCSLALMAVDTGSTLEVQTDLARYLGEFKDMALMCGAADLPYTMTVSFGEAGETEDSVRTKLEFLRDTDPALAILRVGIRVLPGTREAKMAITEGIIESESDLIRPVFHVEESVQSWIEEELESAVRGRPRWNLM